MIRTILAVIYVVIFLIVSIPVQLVEWIIGKFSRKLKDRSTLVMVAWGFRCVQFISGTSVTFLGEENIPKDQAVLYIGNHRSIFDIVITYGNMKSPCGYVSKKENAKIPILAPLMRSLYCQFLDRDDIKNGLKTILSCIEDVKKGISIFIFPEGTRNRTEAPLLPFHQGSFKVAEKTGCPIIPVTMNHTEEIFENHFPRLKRTHVVVEYGTPILPDSYSKEDRRRLSEITQQVIAETYEKNKALV